MTHCGRVRLSDIAHVNPRTDVRLLDDHVEVSFIPMSDVSNGARWVTRQSRSLHEVSSGYTVFQEGDVLFAKITPCMENGKGCRASGLKNGLGFGSTEFHVLRAKDSADAEYVFQWTIFPELRSKASRRMTGSAGQQRVPADFFDQVIIPRTLKAEQSTIARVLSTVDCAIEQTEALIAKHERIKTGLMQDLLTRGIDEHGRLRDPATHKFKPSPLGLVPDEWQIVALGSEYVSSNITSGPRGWAKYYADQGAVFLRLSNLTRKHINLRWDDVKFVKPPPAAEGMRTAVDPGDLLISITADLGMIGVVPEELDQAYVNQHIALIRLNREKVDPWFLGNWLASHKGQEWFSQMNESGAKAGLNLPTIAAMPVVLPRLHEQREIAGILSLTDEGLDCEDAVMHKLARLKTGLMQDLLTGKVSVEPLLSEKDPLR